MDNKLIHETNLATFKKVIEHLSNQEFDLCVSYLAEDARCEWPFIPRPDLSDATIGRESAKQVFMQMEQCEFEPYRYSFERIYSLEDPNTVIAEYRAQSLHRPSGKLYKNRYISILEFKNGEISLWREYLNPLPIYEVLDIAIEDAF